MAISVNNQNLLNDLTASGVDPSIIAGLKKEFDEKPAADQTLNRSILSQKSFNEYSSKKDQEIKTLKDNVSQLEALKSSVSSGALNYDKKLLEAAAEQISKIEDFLIKEGYDEDDVRNVNVKVKTDLQKALDATNVEPDKLKKVEDDKVSNNLDPNKKYIEQGQLEDVLKTSMGNLASGSMRMATKIVKYATKAGALGIEITDEKFDGFHDALVKGFESGKNEEQIADEYFGFTATAKAKSDADVEARVAAAELKGRTEALKENGVTIRRAQSDAGSPVLDRLRSMNKKAQSVVIDPENLPKNKEGDPEYFRLNLRGEARPLDEIGRRIKHSDKAASRYATLRETMDADGMPIGAVNT